MPSLCGLLRMLMGKRYIPSVCATMALVLTLMSGQAMLCQSVPLAVTPPMGWNSWNHFGAKVTDADVRATADAMVASGMRDAGYTYVNIDDDWEGERDAQGNIHGNIRFPDMKALADYVHSKGLKLGIYSSPGTKTCEGNAGSYGYEQKDADTFAAWGVDFLKYDLCSYMDEMKLHDPKQDPQLALAMMKESPATASSTSRVAATDGSRSRASVWPSRSSRPPRSARSANPQSASPAAKMHQALVNTHRPIVYSICQYGVGSVWEWGPKVGANLWRTTDDIRDDYRSMALIGFSQAGLENFAGPDHWNDPDMLVVGSGGMTADQSRTQMSIWSMLAALLLAGNDLSKMDGVTKSILINREVIAVDQDKLGIQGSRVGPPQIWMKPLSGGAKAVAMFNYVTDDEAEPQTLQFKDVGFDGPVHVRDLWAHKDLGVLEGSYTVTIPQGGVVMLRLWH